jgi:hypothetical protein
MHRPSDEPTLARCPMSEFSEFHYRQKMEPKGSSVLPPEMIRRELAYRGFLLTRTDPNQGHMWAISDADRKPVAGLGGAFTNHRLAQETIDRFIADKEREEQKLN